MRRLATSTAIAAAVALGAAVAPISDAHATATDGLVEAAERTAEWEVYALDAVEGSEHYDEVIFTVCAPWELRDVPLLVDYTTRDGTATAGSDYVATSGTVSLGPSTDHCFEVRVDTIDDDVLEGIPYEVPAVEHLFLDLSTAGAEEIFGDAAHTQGFIHDGLDDWPMILSMTRARVTEGSSAGMVIWTPNPKPYPVTVKWATEAMSADANDFQPSDGEVTLAPGENQQWISVPTHDDGIDEPSEVFRIVLSDNRPAEGSIINPSPGGRITLEDNDPMPHVAVEDVSATVPRNPGADSSLQFRVSLSKPSGHVVAVDYATEDGTLRAGVDYEAVEGSLAFPPGVTSQTVSVSLTGLPNDLESGTLDLVLDDPVEATLGTARGVANVTVTDDPLVIPTPTTATPPHPAPPRTVPFPPAAAAAATQPPSIAARTDTPAAPRVAVAEPTHTGRRPDAVESRSAVRGAPDRAGAAPTPDASRTLPPRHTDLSTSPTAVRRASGAAGGSLALAAGAWTLTLRRRRRWLAPRSRATA